MTTAARHPLVEDYLSRLWAEAGRLPVDQARELVADIEEHLSAAVAPEATETEVRNTLERLGTPAELVDAAEGERAPTPPQRRPVSPVIALWCLVIAEVTFILVPLAGAFWAVGLIFTIKADIWSQRAKVWALVVLGSGFPLAFVLAGLSLVSVRTCSQQYVNGKLVHDTCAGVDPVTVVAWVVLGTYLLLQALTIWRLTRSARRR